MKWLKSLIAACSPTPIMSGQIWRHEDANPWDTTEYEVLDVKDGWVKYCERGSPDPKRHTRFREKYWFRSSYRLVRANIREPASDSV